MYWLVPISLFWTYRYLFRYVYDPTIISIKCYLQSLLDKSAFTSEKVVPDCVRCEPPYPDRDELVERRYALVWINPTTVRDTILYPREWESSSPEYTLETRCQRDFVGRGYWNRRANIFKNTRLNIHISVYKQIKRSEIITNLRKL